MYLSTVSEWMSWIDSLHSKEIDLGLERIKKAAEHLQVLSPQCPVIIVGGTNGKGSTVAGLESIYRESGYQTGTFTSPILFRQNEQVKINNVEVSDQTLCDAFAEVEASRQLVPLTPFEFCTLAALCIFKRHDLDILIMEVGLGGRLDAVNILEPDVSIVTSIGIDHVNWLGDTREKIGYEKAGIFRKNKPAICGDAEPPTSLIQSAQEKQANLYCQGKDFEFTQTSADSWNWKYKNKNKNESKNQNANYVYENLPLNSLALQNMSSVLMAITLLQNSLPVNRDAINAGLKNVSLPARIEIIKGDVTEIFDVSHNPDAIKFLSNKIKNLENEIEHANKNINAKVNENKNSNLKANKNSNENKKINLENKTKKNLAVFSMLSDKDILKSILAINDEINEWYVAPLKTKRSASKEELKKYFQLAKINNVKFFSDIKEAYQHAKLNAKSGDKIIVFGSFHAVAESRL